MEKCTDSRICRCCLSTNSYRDLYTDYFSEGIVENYAALLIKTFDIAISKNDMNMICEDCVMRLRDAASFKQLVQNSEKTFLDTYVMTADGVPVKFELESNASDHDYGDKYDDGFIQKNKNINKACLKTEHDIDKVPVIKLTKLKTEKKDTKTPTEQQISSNKVVFHYAPHCKESIKATRKRNITKTEKPKRNKIEVDKSLQDIRDNTMQLLSHSNMCPFVSRRMKYACYTCSQTYTDINELRHHSKLHPFDDLKRSFANLRGLTYKNVDISNLACNICNGSCIDLNALKMHLISQHSIKFNDGEYFLKPYKLTEGFDCVICGEKFSNFKRLTSHLNTHSSSNVCEICGVSYFNRESLRNHINNVHVEKKCTQCSVILPSTSARNKHMRVAHNIKQLIKRYCTKCDMTFRYSYLLKEHMVEKHGAKLEVSVCPQCGKGFRLGNNLNTHMRNVHMGERNHACSICEMRFFTSTDRVRHERTHGDAKPFSCEFCEVKFSSKDSVRRHLKRQHGKLK